MTALVYYVPSIALSDPIYIRHDSYMYLDVRLVGYLCGGQELTSVIQGSFLDDGKV